RSRAHDLQQLLSEARDRRLREQRPGPAGLAHGLVSATGGPPPVTSPPEPDSGGPPMSVHRVLEHAVEGGLRELERPARGLLLAGLSGGLDVAFGPMLMAVLLTLSAGSPELWRTILAANAYTVGFIFVVLGRSELFTEHTTLASFPVLERRASLRDLGRLWSLVYASNVAGAFASGALGAFILTSLGVARASAIDEMGYDVVAHPWWTILVSAVLAGWLMGLMSWMSRTTRQMIGLMAVVWIVTLTIGLAKLHHCIAGTAEVAMAVVLPSGRVGFGDALHFLLWATLGTAIGGSVFVALVKFGHARIPSRRDAA